MQIEQNAKIPKYKHDKIQKDKIRIAKIQMYHKKMQQNAKIPKYKHDKIQKDKIQT